MHTERTSQIFASKSPPAVASDAYERRLCDLCRKMLQEDGLDKMRTDAGYVHSLLRSFASRVDCVLCQFLWKEDLSDGRPRTVCRLGDVVDICASQDPSIQEQHAEGKSPLQVCFNIAELGSPTRDVLFINLKRGVGLYAEEHLPCFFLRMFDPVDLIPLPELDPISVMRSRLSSGRSPSVFKQWQFDWDNGPHYMAKALQCLLDRCENTHDGCQLSTSGELPTRVLLISTRSSRIHVRLVTPTRGETAKYATLSYCWGGPQRLQLTRNNFTLLEQEGFDSNILPKTIQDAVITTHHLGLKYLWIDALCIIQDDPKDREREIKRMYSIYRDSFFTIVAATASSVDQGFRKPSLAYQRNGSTPLAIRVPITAKSGSRPKDVVLSPDHRIDTSQYPINRRGWTFQESFMPSRVLVIGDPEPYLRCRTMDLVPLPGSLLCYSASIMEPKRPNISNTSQFGDLWYWIVNQYSTRQFSFIEDKAFAMEGVVEMLRMQFGGKCYHGVWTTCALECLVWNRRTPPRKAGEIIASHTRIHGIPTWSWQSVDGPVLTCSWSEDHRWDYKATFEFLGACHEELHLTTRGLKCEETAPDSRSVLDVSCVEDSSESKRIGEGPIRDEFVVLLVLGRLRGSRWFYALRGVHEGNNVHRRIGLTWIDDLEVDDWNSLPMKTFVVR
jgi:hypothetical protein